MCGSFDHASSLGFNLSDEERRSRMTNGTVANWARHGSARQFERQRGQRNQSLVDLARSASELCGPDVRKYWLQAVLSVQSDVVGSILARAPGLSDAVKVVQARLGHASASQTLDTYSHLWPDSDDRTRTAVDSVLSADYVRTEGVVDGRTP